MRMETSVTEVAMHYGFYHLGRFAGYYKQSFWRAALGNARPNPLNSPPAFATRIEPLSSPPPRIGWHLFTP